jgi:hypothetical protein
MLPAFRRERNIVMLAPEPSEEDLLDAIRRYVSAPVPRGSGPPGRAQTPRSSETAEDAVNGSADPGTRRTAP